MAHTPGPWESRDGEITTQQMGGRSFRRIAAVQDYGIGSLREVDEANARLMATAPDLLAALKRLVEYCNNHSDYDAIGEADAAISKAEGRGE